MTKIQRKNQASRQEVSIFWQEFRKN